MCLFRSLRIINILSVLIFLPFLSVADSKIHFSEYKILLTDKQSSFDYRILNRGDTAASCRISFVDYMVAEDGKLTTPKEGQAPDNSGKSMLRASPSRILIQANDAQKVKVLARGVRNSDDGEWHSYLSIKCKDDTPELQSGVNIVPNFVFNIPVTIRKGPLTATAEISEAKLVTKDENVWVELVLDRSGTRSLYGDVTIADGAGTQLGVLKGVSHYLQASRVPLKIKLNQQPVGEVNITFTEDSRFGGDVTVSYALN
jgi:hypothetical protein